MLSDHGPVDGAQMADWPITYDDLAPYYDIVERRVGVQGDRDDAGAHPGAGPAPAQFVMPPNPTGYAAPCSPKVPPDGLRGLPLPGRGQLRDLRRPPRLQLLRDVLRLRLRDQRSRRRPGLLANPAMRTGRVRVISRAFVHRIETSGDGDGGRGPCTGRRLRSRAPAARRNGRGRRQPDQHSTVAAPVAQRHAPRRSRQRLRPAGPEHDVPQLHPGGRALPRGHQAAARTVHDARGGRPGRSVHRPGGDRARRALHRRRHRPGRVGAGGGRRGADARRDDRLRAAAQASHEGRHPARPGGRLAAHPPGPAAGRQQRRPGPEGQGLPGAPGRPDHLQPAPAREGRRDLPRRPPPGHAPAGARCSCRRHRPVPAHERWHHLHRPPRGHRADGPDPRTSVCAPSGRLHEVDNVYVAEDRRSRRSRASTRP